MSRSSLFLLVVLAAAVQTGFSQTRAAWIKAADKAYENKDFYSAYKYYSIALEYDSSRLDTWYQLAQSARQFGADVSAERAYTWVLNSPAAKDFPETAFRLGGVKQRQGKYEEAIDLFQQFLDQEPVPDEQLREEALDRLEKSKWALEIIQEADTVTIRHLGDKINSPYSDFAPALAGDTLYYSSFKFLFRRDSLNPPRNFIKILYSVDGSAGKPLADAFDFTDRHVAHSAFNQDRSRMYFNICEYTSATDIRCDLYFSERLPNGKWGAGQKLPINAEGFTSTQPNVGIDFTSGQEFLFFASDRSGGRGGLDIWRTTILEDGQFSEPENLFDINTTGNEATPFYDALTRTLYFSSDGYLTLGGYDIFQSRQLPGGWSEPEHMGAPLNSSYDDVYYSVFDNGAKIFFSSNRPDSAAIFWDETKDACCNDIYMVEVDISVELHLLTFDDNDKTPLWGTTVELYEITADGQKRLLAGVENPGGHDFNFPLEHGKKYWIQASKDGYLPAFTEIDLSDPADRTIKKIERKLYLPRNPDVTLEVTTFHKWDGTPLPGATVRLYEFIDGIPVQIDSLRNPFDNNFTFPLEPGKKYMVKGEHPDFAPDVDTIDLNSPELAGKTRVERELFLAPAIRLEVQTMKKLDLQPLYDGMVTLYELIDGVEIPIDSLRIPDDYNFVFPLEPGKVYTIKGAHEGYFPAKDTIDLTQPLEPGQTTLKRSLLLDQALEARTFDAADGTPLEGATVELYELTPEGPKLIGRITNDYNNDFLFPIDSDKQYFIAAHKGGFDSVSDTLRFTPEDVAKSGGTIRVDLFLERTSFEDFLPLALYFDNDSPDPRTWNITTTKNYVETNRAYYGRKEQFIQEFTKGMRDEEKFLTANLFNNFFDREVQGGFRDLESFTEKLLRFLQNGNSITIRLKGFASPRASSQYNKNLSARRVDCVKNHFRSFQDGVFMPFINSGHLGIEEEALGESTADLTRISDRIDDPKNSIFSIIASVERRVEIVEVKTGGSGGRPTSK